MNLLRILSAGIVIITIAPAFAQFGLHNQENILVILQGQVQDKDGTPVAEAEVRCWWVLETLGFPPPVLDEFSPVQTDAAGAFLIHARVPGNQRFGFLDIRHPGFGRRLVHFKGHIKLHQYRGALDPEDLPPPDPPNDLPVTTLPSRATVSGVVTDPDGLPVANAHITPLLLIQQDRPGPGTYVQDPGPLFDITSDAAGRFHVDELPADEAFAIRAWHPEVGKTELGVLPQRTNTDHFFLLPGGDPIPLTLPGGGSLEGHVAMYNGAPLPENIEIQIRHVNIPESPPMNVPIDHSTGRYHAAPLAPGHYEILALAPSLHASPTHALVEPKAPTTASNHTVGPGSVLSGVIIHAETGENIDDATVQFVLNYEGKEPKFFDNNASPGSFEFSSAPGNASLFTIGLNCDVVEDDRSHPLTLEHGLLHDTIRIRALPHRWIKGTVYLPDGQPATGATIHYEGEKRATSNETGAFSFRLSNKAFERNDAAFTVIYCGAPLLLGFVPLTPDTGDGGMLTLSLMEAAELTGIVTDAEKKPIANYPVDFSQENLSGHRVYTNDQGLFHFTNLFPNRAGGVGPYLARTTNVPPLLPGDRHDAGRLYADPTQHLPTPFTRLQCVKNISKAAP